MDSQKIGPQAKLGVIVSDPIWSALLSRLSILETETIGNMEIALAASAGGTTTHICRRSIEPEYPHVLSSNAVIDELVRKDCTSLVTTAVCGALTADLEVPSLVVLDQFLDERVVGRMNQAWPAVVDAEEPFIDITYPYCETMRNRIASELEGTSVRLYKTGCYVGVDGPRYETAAEARMFCGFGGDVIGMTAVGEAIAARVRGLCIGTVGIVANYAAGVRGGVVLNEDIRVVASQFADTVAEGVIGIIDDIAGCHDCCGGNCA